MLNYEVKHKMAENFEGIFILKKEIYIAEL